MKENNVTVDKHFSTLLLEKKLKNTILKVLRDVNRILKKDHEKESRVMFRRLGAKEELCIIGVCDDSYKNDDRSVAGEKLWQMRKTWMYPLFIGSQE